MEGHCRILRLDSFQGNVTQERTPRGRSDFQYSEGQAPQSKESSLYLPILADKLVQNPCLGEEYKVEEIFLNPDSQALTILPNCI